MTAPEPRLPLDEDYLWSFEYERAQTALRAMTDGWAHCRHCWHHWHGLPCKNCGCATAVETTAGELL